MSTSPAVRPISSAVAQIPQQSFLPQSFEQLTHLSQMIARSDLAPKDYKGKPENAQIAIMMGLELGVSPMQAIQGIAVINGRPSVWGDLMIALARSHPDCEFISEALTRDSAGVAVMATCTAKRRGQPEQARTFSVEDAKKARLWGKEGPWSQYPQRMLQMRARSWCLRDVFADALKGLASADEQQDAQEVTVTAQSAVQMPQRKAVAAPVEAPEAVEDAEVIDTETGEVTTEAKPEPQAEAKAAGGELSAMPAGMRRSIEAKLTAAGLDVAALAAAHPGIGTDAATAGPDANRAFTWIKAQQS